MGWLGNTFLIIGAYCQRPHRRWPFLMTVIGEGIWVAECARMDPVRLDMLFICVLFAALAARNFWKWEGYRQWERKTRPRP